jgi:hypothetical protein
VGNVYPLAEASEPGRTRTASRIAHVVGGGITMTPLVHVKHRHVEYFHGHPLHGTFSLIASFILAGLIVITVLVTTAR